MILRQRALQLGISRIASTHGTRLSPRKHFSTAASRMVEAKDISPSSNSHPEELARQTTELVDNGQWSLCNGGKGLERVFKFKTFKATWDFMDTVAAECKKRKHHPEWTNIYNRTHVRWTTHNPEGLSEKDVEMARFCDEVAAEKGEVDVGGEKLGGSCSSSFADEARNCCSGKSR